MNELPKELNSFLPIELNHFHFKKRYFIYFLYNGGNLRYIGRTTTHPLTRIVGHKDKKFTDIYYVEVDRPTYFTLEKKLITKYRPYYNYNGHYHRRPKKKGKQALL